MCRCICMCARLRVYMHVCTSARCVHVCACICMCARLRVYMHVCTSARQPVCVHKCVYGAVCFSVVLYNVRIRKLS